jgi:hypothetical protein
MASSSLSNDVIGDLLDTETQDWRSEQKTKRPARKLNSVDKTFVKMDSQQVEEDQGRDDDRDAVTKSYANSTVFLWNYIKISLNCANITNCFWNKFGPSGDLYQFKDDQK